jgi:hypothetical protein
VLGRELCAYRVLSTGQRVHDILELGHRPLQRPPAVDEARLLLSASTVARAIAVLIVLALLFPATRAAAQQARLIVTVVDYINNAPIAGAQIQVFRLQPGWTPQAILIARKKTPKSGVVVIDVEPLADYEIRVTRGGPVPYPILEARSTDAE